MTPPSVVISLLHSTRGRPEKAVRAMRLWAERAACPGNIEYIRVVDSDDQSAGNIAGETDRRFRRCAHIPVPPRGSAPAWNDAYKMSTGALCVQMSDDVEPPAEYDRLLVERLRARFTVHGGTLSWKDFRFVVAVSDGFRKDRLLTTFIATRQYCENEGYFLCPEYKSIHSDGDATFRAYKNDRAGNATVIEARDIVFEHRHHWRDASVPWDRTYEQQNDPHRYEDGGKLFQARNPDWLTATMADGEKVVNWL